MAKKRQIIDNPKKLAQFCATIAAEKIAANIVAMDLSAHETAPANYFVLCSTDTEVQSQAILDALLREAKNCGLNKPKVEGTDNSEWIIADFFDVVMHIMLAPIRDFYDIEHLWNQAKLYEFNAETGRLNAMKE